MKAIPFDLFAPPRSRSAPGAAADNPLSVGDLALRAREVVESHLRPIWVRGEIVDFKRHRNGHWYFCLRDRLAQIRCVVWSGDQHRMPAPPDDGMQVVVFGHMTVYTARADLQLKVTRIDAEGDGLWRKAMELTLAKLRREGLLDESRARAAAEAALKDAQPMSDNAYKVVIAKVIVRRAIMHAAGLEAA